MDPSGGTYASLIGPGETSPTGLLEQTGPFTIQSHNVTAEFDLGGSGQIELSVGTGSTLSFIAFNPGSGGQIDISGAALVAIAAKTVRVGGTVGTVVGTVGAAVGFFGTTGNVQQASDGTLATLISILQSYGLIS